MRDNDVEILLVTTRKSAAGRCQRGGPSGI